MIQNIIFDFGGVLLNLDMQKTYSALSNLLKIPLEYPDVPEDIRHLVWSYETGKINNESFIWQLQQRCPNPKPQGYDVIQAWNAMLLGWEKQTFPFLEKLKKKYRLFLLSNTNVLHIEWVRQDLKLNHAIVDFEAKFFEKAYYSYDIQKHKPDPKIYQYVLDDARIIAEETLFIDDNLANIMAAHELGIHVYHHDPTKNLIDIFDKNGWMPIN
ncbi:MAG: HAD family phosphatase [Saprospiraceae bacterium]